MVVSFIHSFIPSLTHPKNVLNASSEKSLVEDIKDTDMNSISFLSRYIHGLMREMDSEQTECSHRNNHMCGVKGWFPNPVCVGREGSLWEGCLGEF